MRRKKIENLIEGMWSWEIVGEQGMKNRHPCLMNKKRRNDGGLGRETKKKKQCQVHNFNIEEDNSELTYLY